MEKKTITRRNPIKQEHRRRRASRLPTTPPAEARQKQRSQDALQNIPSPKQRLRAGFVRRWAFGPRHCRHGEEAKPRKDDVTAAESSLVVCFELPTYQAGNLYCIERAKKRRSHAFAHFDKAISLPFKLMS
ncbi:hypothetical protein BHE74_00058951 [Ensete ventricosum]|nr:hypothetical protein GW17_00056010 [Ensete ventricosum]RWW36056.1 hypothetical protein BHE74_00058951 [Ensete ventricosum]